MFSRGFPSIVCYLFAASVLFSADVAGAPLPTLQAELRPDHVQARLKSTRVTVRCNADPPEPLAACTFRVWAVEAAIDGPPMDVEAGTNRSLTVEHPGRENATLRVDLYGEEFARGRCSVGVDGLEGVDVLVGCKITTETKRSVINTMSVFFDMGRRFLLDANNRQLAVRAQGRADVLVRAHAAGVKLRRCETVLRSKDRLTVLPGHDGGSNVVTSVPSSTRYEALGSDRMDDGECGFSVDNVTSADAGVVFVRAETTAGLVAAQALAIVVRTPYHHEVTLDKTAYSAGEEATATCTLRALPQASASCRWSLDGLALANARAGDFLELGWSWPWQSPTLTHRVTFKLDGEGTAPCVRCQVGSAVKEACVHWRKTPEADKTATQISSEVSPTEDYTRHSTTDAYSNDSLIKTRLVESLGPSVPASDPVSIAEDEPAAREVLAETEATGFVASLFSGNHTGTLVVCNFLLMVVIVVVACVVTAYAKMTERWCFDASRSNQDRKRSIDTIYEEIPLDYLRTLQPPCIPPLPRGWSDLDAVPMEPAPALPGLDNPEYMIVQDDAKDDTSEADGYMEPRYHNMK